MPYEHLFTPLRIGPHTARNRIVFGSHFTMFTEPAARFGEPGFYGARFGRYLAERAAGGVGVVIAGQAQVHPTTAYQMTNNAAAWDEAAVPHFLDVTRPVHAEGALVFLQLAHNGGVNFGSWSKLPAWAPSAVVNSTEAPKAMEREEIAEVIEFFARSARNAAAAGFDGIEIHAAHGYLIHEFLSPRSNQRCDEYGGSLEKRMRFGVEVLEAVRAAVGDKVAVGLRLVGDEGAGGGISASDAGEIAARFEALGLVDFLNVSVGLSGLGMVRPLYAKHGFGVYAARAVKDAVKRTPVFAVHRLLMPDEAEGVIARGEADAVTIVRALIADPEWPAKAKRGEAETIRRCTGCNQGCYGHLTQSLPVTCVTNPGVGREETLSASAIRPAARRRRVVIVGGGPGGLEAAWVAAARGHEVILLEKEQRLGGKINLARELPGRGEIGDFADWRAGECGRRGVDIRLGVSATADDVLALKPDAVVVATGGRATVFGTSKMHPMPIAGSDPTFVVDHEEAQRRAAEIGPRILILDTVGHIEAIGLGELLARVGKQVTVVTALPTPMLLDRETAGEALPRMVRAGAAWRPNTALIHIGDRQATLVDIFKREPETVEVDTVVIRTHGLPDDALYFSLKGRVETLLRVGDAVAVRTADRAIFDGHMAGREI